MISRILVKFSLIIVIVVLLILGLLQMIYKSSFIPQSEIVKRQIDTTSGFELQWEKSLTSLPTTIDNGKVNRESVFLNVQKNSVIVPVWDSATAFFLGNKLRSFDLRTGDENWQRPINFFHPIAFAGNSQSTFIVIENVEPPAVLKNQCNPNLPHCVAVEIIKFDNTTGKKEWTTYYPNMKSIMTLGTSDEFINLIGSAYRGEYISKISLDVESGSPLQVFQRNPIVGDAVFNQKLETINFDPYEVVSNYAEAENYFFFLSNEDAKQRLWAINEDSNQIAGYIEFNGSEFRTLIDAHPIGFTVDIFEEYIVVYLGDSEQLLVFSFEPLIP